MRELRLRVPREAVEDVLDRLLPLLGGGVREVPDGNQVELRMRAAPLLEREDLIYAAGGWPYELSECSVSDDWRERRLSEHRHDPIAGQLVVRPDWAPAAPAGLLEIALSERAAFGAGTHPTTRACLELLLEARPAGSFADLGCGSGVLAILAAKLGWDPVVAIDVQRSSVQTAIENAVANGVTIGALTADLSATAPPPAHGVAANIPARIHVHVAAALSDPLPRLVLLSGFGPDDAASAIGAYIARGLRESRRIERSGWVVSLLG